MQQERRTDVKHFNGSNRDKWKRALLIVLASLPPLTYNACDKNNSLVPLSNVRIESVATSSVQLNFCDPPPQPLKTLVKTIIVLDHSGSNGDNYLMDTQGDGGPLITASGGLTHGIQYATDPTKQLRYGTPTTTGTLLNYLSTLSSTYNAATATQYFALVDFNSSVATYPSSGFTSDIPSFYQEVLTDAGQIPAVNPYKVLTADTGNTDYIGALTKVQNLIQADITSAQNCLNKPTNGCSSAASTYIVVFMSDGSPIMDLELSSDGSVAKLNNGSCNGQDQLIAPGYICEETPTAILGLVNSISSLAATYQQVVIGVNLFTIYYYNPSNNLDASGRSLLKSMALEGNGQPYSAQSGSNINYNSYSLSDVFVTNASGVWWTDGVFHADANGDGLPDDVAKTWTSNPKLAGIKSLVSYELMSNGGTVDTSKCSGYIATSSPLTYTTKGNDPNGLNDCEKVLLNDKAGVGVPDSNQDSIPDWLEFKNLVPFQAGTSPAVNTPQSDGYSIYEKIKYSLPVNFPINNMPNIVPADYQMTVTSSVNSVNCYNVNVTNFPTVTTNDKVRVDLVFKSNLINNSTIYKVGYKSFGNITTPLIINDPIVDPSKNNSTTWSTWSQ